MAQKFTSIVIDDSVTYSLREICDAWGVYGERVVELVEYGIIEPRGDHPANWRFDARAMFRARRALKLSQDLGINLAGVSLALELLDELEALRLEVNRLSRLTP